MAKIQEYEARNVKLDPSNMGEQAVQQAARRMGAFTDQMASGAREIGRMEAEADSLIGTQTDAFLRFKGLEDRGIAINTKGAGKNERTLIGTGSNPGITRNYNDLAQRVRGATALSRAARNAVDANAPKDDVENGVTVLRGGANPNTDNSGVTVLRGGQPTPATPKYDTPGINFDPTRAVLEDRVGPTVDAYGRPIKEKIFAPGATDDTGLEPVNPALTPGVQGTEFRGPLPGSVPVGGTNDLTDPTFNSNGVPPELSTNTGTQWPTPLPAPPGYGVPSQAGQDIPLTTDMSSTPGNAGNFNPETPQYGIPIDGQNAPAVWQDLNGGM